MNWTEALFGYPNAAEESGRAWCGHECLDLSTSLGRSVDPDGGFDADTELPAQITA
jgi:hypothetical protein